MRVLFAISTLGAGGAERVITTLADGLAERGHSVALLTLSDAGSGFFSTGPAVERIALGLLGSSTGAWQRIANNARRVAAFRRELRRWRPDVLVSFMTETNVLALAACLGGTLPAIVSERSDPREQPVGRAWHALRRRLYPRARALVVQTPSIADWCRSAWRVPQTVVIPNPVRVRPAPPGPPPFEGAPYLLGVGRLDRPKGFDLLIRAFALVAVEWPELELAIAGDGEEAAPLAALAVAAGVAGRVRFLGQVRDVERLMSHAHAFVLSSRHEGFPNVLLEALASGAAAIATDCRSGPREILGDGRYGLLVPVDSPAAIADAVRQLRDDPRRREELRAAAPAAVARYAPAAVLDRWERLLEQAAGNAA